MQTKITNIYSEIRKLGIQYAALASDLYIPVNEQTKQLIAHYEHKCNVTTFVDNITGTLWYEIPFAFTPYWDNILANGDMSC